MKLFRIIALSLILGSLTLGELPAQVSVRRTPKKESSSAAATTEKKAVTEKKKASEKKAEATNANVEKPEPKATANTAAAGGVTKATSGAAKRRAPQSQSGSFAGISADGKTLREQAFDDYQKPAADAYIPWQHVVYRELNLEQGPNASLYFPVEPQDGLTNLFRVILDEITHHRIKGYEYLDGREVFSEKYEIKIQEVLDKFQIIYEVKPGEKGGADVYEIEEADVPSNEVLSYYIKERWEFNYRTSTYGPHVLAICPVLHRAGDFGGDAVRYPMFWLNFDDLAPYLRKHLIMSDGMNNAPRFTMEDFFKLEQYKGPIYKVQNVRGLTLMQQYPDADTLKLMQQKIEAELRGFGKNIWVPEPKAEETAPESRRQRRAPQSAAEAPADSAAVTGSAAVTAPGSSDEEVEKRNRRTKEAVDMEAVAAEKEAKAKKGRSVRRTR